jgi:hypothetical protein
MLRDDFVSPQWEALLPPHGRQLVKSLDLQAPSENTSGQVPSTGKCLIMSRYMKVLLYILGSVTSLCSTESSNNPLHDHLHLIPQS